MEGWVKLHRKLLENDELMGDESGYNVFTKLLMIVDKNTGQYRAGRFQLGEMLRRKPTTVYKILHRLENYKVLELSSNTKYTLISICNWEKYQSNSNNKVTTKGQQSNNKVTLNKNIRIKEYKNTSINTSKATPPDILADGLILAKSTKPKAKPDPNINELVNAFEAQFQLKMKRPLQQRIAARNLIRRYGLADSMGAVKAAHAVIRERYAPQILNLEDLWDKWDKLGAYYLKKREEQKQKVAIIEDD